MISSQNNIRKYRSKGHEQVSSRSQIKWEISSQFFSLLRKPELYHKHAWDCHCTFRKVFAPCDILFVQNSKKREFITPRRFPQTGLIFREKKWHLTFYMHSSENRAGIFFNNSRKLHWNPDPVKLSFVLLAAQCCGFLFAFLHQFVCFQENGKKKSSSKRTNVLLVLVPLNCIG